MCRQDNSHQISSQCATKTELSAEAAAQIIKPNLPSPSTEVNLSRSLSVFLFDWDDTLFPTTALTHWGPERLSEALKAVDSIAANLLAAVLATPNSRLIILTNARTSWVQHAASNFMPKLNALLAARNNEVLLISAYRDRSDFSEASTEAYEQAVRSAKSEAVRPLSIAMRRVVEEMQAESFQVISVGDQPHDLMAAHALRHLMSSEHHESFVKTIAMKPMPTGPELANELSTMRKSLPKLLSVGRNFHQLMHQPQRAPAARAPVAEVQATPTPEEVKPPQTNAPDTSASDVSAKASTACTPSVLTSSSLHNTQLGIAAAAAAEPVSTGTKDASMVLPSEGAYQKRSDVSKRRRQPRQRRACAQV